MAKEACSLLEGAVEESNHPGYSSKYIRRLTADLYTTMGCIEYELNLQNHGRPWFQKARSHRQMLIQNDNAENFDLQVMALGDGNIGLASLAETGTADSGIAAWTFLIDNFKGKSESGRSVWAANLAIAYRFQGNFAESLKWCKVSRGWTEDAYGDDSLSMAMSVRTFHLTRVMD